MDPQTRGKDLVTPGLVDCGTAHPQAEDVTVVGGEGREPRVRPRYPLQALPIVPPGNDLAVGLKPMLRLLLPARAM